MRVDNLRNKTSRTLVQWESSYNLASELSLWADSLPVLLRLFPYVFLH